eukprot:5265-Heterococcus_DN1.PRE.18
MQAAASYQPQVAEFLISKGASVHAVDASYFTALHYAADTDNSSSILNVLLQHGASEHASYHVDSPSPLDMAAMRGRLQSVEVLIAAGADTLRSSASGCTALHFAVHCGHAALVKLFLQHGLH